jgi:hypothetical protein
MSRVSVRGVISVLVGAVVSTATTCGPPDPVPDTGARETGFTEPDVSISAIDNARFELRGAGAETTIQLRATLSARCLAEVPEYLWGYPAGSLQVSYEASNVSTEDTAAAMPAPPWELDSGDTGGADTATPDSGARDTGASDTGGWDSGTSDTGAPDTGVSDTASWDTSTSDTGTSDTGTSDTGSVDTGALDTGRSDTGAGDTGTSDSGEPSLDARLRVEILASDGTSEGDDRIRVPDGSTAASALTVESAWRACVRDTSCELTWTVRLTLEEGSALDGQVTAEGRLNICSSGDPEAGDLTLVVE